MLSSFSYRNKNQDICDLLTCDLSINIKVAFRRGVGDKIPYRISSLMAAHFHLTSLT